MHGRNGFTNMADDRVEHLKMVQAVIARMAQNSFLLKGWSVTLVTAMNALAISGKRPGYAILALFPALAFWGLDAFYLRQERLFRALHQTIVEGGIEITPFSLRTDAVQGKVQSWVETAITFTVMGLHVVVLAVIGAMIAWGFVKE
jgi:hypothetical protein